jgi:hypothetical protein
MSPQPAARRSPPVSPEPPARRGPTMITKDLVSKIGTKVFAIMKTRASDAVAAALGMLVLAWPLAWAPAWAFAAAGGGAVAVLGAGFTPGERRERARGWPAIPVAAAVLSCAYSRAGTAALAAEGVFILAYLLAADAPAGLIRPGRWLRHQGFLVIGGLIGTGAVLAALALHRTSSAWLTVAGLAAAVAAYLIALPSARRARSGGRT